MIDDSHTELNCTCTTASQNVPTIEASSGAVANEAAACDPTVTMVHSTTSVPPAASPEVAAEIVGVLTNAISAQDPTTTPSSLTSCRPVHIQSTGDWVNSRDHNFLLNRFRELFPFGRGGPAEPRAHAAGLSRYLQHLLRLDHGRFWAPKFVLYAYNLSARAAASRAAFVSSRSASRVQPTMSRAEAYGEYLTADQLILCAVYQEECATAARSNQPRPPAPEGLAEYGISSEFISSMTYSVGAMPHTYEASMLRRIEAHSLCQWFGKPTWFLTISPDDGCSIMIIRLVTRGRRQSETVIPSRRMRPFEM